MIAKKISRRWSVVIVFCLWGVLGTFTVACQNQDQNQEHVLLLNDTPIEESEHPIIITGESSFGNNAVTGRACIVMSRKQLNKVCKGDIVIASAINDLWYPQLSVASGIITEKGDRSGHTAGLGKSLGIPVIVGATGATKKIVDGQIIACDPITKNIYHVAYPISHDVRFDTLMMPPKNDIQVGLHDRLAKCEKTGNMRPSYVSEKSAAVGTMDCFVQAVEDNKNVSVLQNMQQYKIKRITKDVYFSHFDKFKKFALSVQSRYKWGKWFGLLESGARATGRDEFTIDCMVIGDLLLDSDEKHFVDVLKRIGTEQYVQYMDLLIDKCSKRPGNINEANWIARVSHKEHVKAVDMPADIDKEKLIAHPKEYKKIENIVSKDERDARIAAGLFALYWMENKLPL